MFGPTKSIQLKAKGPQQEHHKIQPEPSKLCTESKDLPASWPPHYLKRKEAMQGWTPFVLLKKST
jgi:hypothetical protein